MENGKRYLAQQFYQNIEKKDKFYLFGAGEYGEAVYQELEDKLLIAGFIDNNPEKQKENYLLIKKKYTIPTSKR